jgi:phosphoglycolate phosphatase
MKKQYELLIFDWDGTLIDSEANIVSCMVRAMEDAALPVLEADAIRNIIGLGLREALHTLYPTIDESSSRLLVDRYRYHFLTSEPSQLFEGVDVMLKDLGERDYLLAVATGKGRQGLNHALEVTGYLEHFHSSRCADETRSKPHPQMLEEILDELGVAPSAALMIGDTEYDINMAHNAGMDSVAVSYGVHEKERLLQCNPLTCLHSIAELTNWLSH